jgi:hypothetical protein
MSRPRETDLVIPLYRERESLEELFRELEGLEGPKDLRRSRGAESEGDPPALLEGGRVLFVDDASVDGSAATTSRSGSRRACPSPQSCCGTSAIRA